MSNIDKQVFKPAYRLIEFFGGQKETCAALRVKQGTVSGWLNKKHGISSFNAQKAELLTNGEIKASDLCPQLIELNQYKVKTK